MAAKNDVTGDAIVSRVPSQAYLDNHERIFGSKSKASQEQGEKDSPEGARPAQEPGPKPRKPGMR